jgi:hypothetical protein
MRIAAHLPSRLQEGNEGRACLSMCTNGEGQALPLTPSRKREGEE